MGLVYLINAKFKSQRHRYRAKRYRSAITLYNSGATRNAAFWKALGNDLDWSLKGQIVESATPERRWSARGV
ncbi:MAG: hypothetical protein Q8P71_01355, partial [bacterium]|nr:hypothetical protein [bacterium]